MTSPRLRRRHRRDSRSSRARAIQVACLVGVVVLACTAVPCGAHALSDTQRELIVRAGNADDDAERLTLLRELQAQPDLDPAVKADAEKLIAFVEQWVDGRRLSFFSGPVYRTEDYDFGIAPESPLYPLTYLYRGRGVLAATIQSGNIWSYPDRRAEWYGIACGFFEKAREAFPDSRIARMYLGEPIPWERNWPDVPAAPEWAVSQRAGIEGIADIIEWWIDHRLQESGEFGGGWGDDCEMWRWWVPVLIGFDEPKIAEAQAFFSDALMSQEHMQGGYMDRMTDVEHSAEDANDPDDRLDLAGDPAPTDPSAARPASAAPDHHFRPLSLLRSLFSDRLHLLNAAHAARSIGPDGAEGLGLSLAVEPPGGHRAVNLLSAPLPVLRPPGSRAAPLPRGMAAAR